MHQGHLRCHQMHQRIIPIFYILLRFPLAFHPQFDYTPKQEWSKFLTIEAS